jgi:hypothetical protein
MMVKAVAIAFNVVVLLPLALWAAIRESEWRNRNQALVLAAGALLSVVPFITLPDDTEHNLVNVAQALLVVPAVTAIATLHALPWKRVALTAAFVPMTAGSLLSYLGRPPLPIAFERGELHRTSKEGLEKLYTWIRTSTTPDAVFVVDAGRPAKMSGNVSELPAFTGRTLFVDTPTYMTTPHKDFEQRSGLSKRLTSGEALTGQDATYVTALNRPIYLISYSADKEDLLNRMTQLYGAPFFHEGFIAVFDLMATHHVNPI